MADATGVPPASPPNLKGRDLRALQLCLRGEAMTNDGRTSATKDGLSGQIPPFPAPPPPPGHTETLSTLSPLDPQLAQ